MKKVFRDNLALQEKLINQVFKSIFKLPNDELFTLYNSIGDELKKRGVL